MVLKYVLGDRIASAKYRRSVTKFTYLIPFENVASVDICVKGDTLLAASTQGLKKKPALIQNIPSVLMLLMYYMHETMCTFHKSIVGL